jgi:hypothetical protein
LPGSWQSPRHLVPQYEHPHSAGVCFSNNIVIWISKLFLFLGSLISDAGKASIVTHLVNLSSLQARHRVKLNADLLFLFGDIGQR